MRLSLWSRSTGMKGLFQLFKLALSMFTKRGQRFKAPHPYPPPFPPPPPPIPRPVNASFPYGSFASLAGTYDDPGYGPFELCLVSPENLEASPSCQALASNITRLLPGAIESGVPTFFAQWDTLFSSHIRFTHFDCGIFNVSLLTSMVRHRCP